MLCRGFGLGLLDLEFWTRVWVGANWVIWDGANQAYQAIWARFRFKFGLLRPDPEKKFWPRPNLKPAISFWCYA